MIIISGWLSSNYMALVFIRIHKSFTCEYWCKDRVNEKESTHREYMQHFDWRGSNLDFRVQHVESERKCCTFALCVRIWFVWNVTVLSELHDEIEIIMHNRFRRRPFMCWTQGVVISYTFHKNHKACSYVRFGTHSPTQRYSVDTNKRISTHTHTHWTFAYFGTKMYAHIGRVLVNIFLPFRIKS